MPSLVNISNIKKRFGNLQAVNDVSLEIEKGEVLGFLGPNGAGKTTTMRIITGYLKADSGSIFINGLDSSLNKLEVRKKIGYLPEGGPLYNDMTPYTFLSFIGQIRDLEGTSLKNRMDFVIQRLHLQDVLHQTIDTLSKGYKRRVAFAQAILHDPEVLILDEPTDGLDPNQKFEVRELIKSMAKDKAIIISTHILEEVEAICTTTTIIANGKIVASGDPKSITAKATNNNSVFIKLKKDSADKILGEILKIKNVNKVKMEGTKSIVAFPKPGKEILGDISTALFQGQYQVEELYLKGHSLEEAFRELTN